MPPEAAGLGAPESGLILGALCPDRLAGAFEGLGDRCEFGIVQRFCGIEPLGLLRFATMPHPYLLNLLRTRFALLDDPQAVSVFLQPGDDEWWGCVELCGLTYHTGRDSAEISRDEALRGERRRLPFLKRKLLEDMQSGHKIFLRRDPGRGAREIATLREAIGRYGPHDLFWVDQTTDPQRAGMVTFLSDGTASGWLDRFWPYGAPDPEGLRLWLDLLERALAVLRPAQWTAMRAEAMASLAPADASLAALQWRGSQNASGQIVAEPPPQPGIKVIRHVLQRDTTPDTGLVAGCAAAGLAPGCAYVVSAWVWVPQAFSGWIGMHFPGLPWIKIWPADMDRRDCWQKLVTSARMPLEPGSCTAGVVAVASAGSCFMSAGWRLERGVAPET